MTANELLALPCVPRLDRWLFGGELVERWNGANFHTPGHAAVTANVSAILGRWCRAHRPHRAFGPDCPYLLAYDPDTLLSFDASVVASRGSNALQVRDEYVEGPPSLAVEVVELDEDSDLLIRLVAESLRYGVGTVWVIDPVEKITVVHRRGVKPVYVNGGMLLTGGDALPGFQCPVAEIFE